MIVTYSAGRAKDNYKKATSNFVKHCILFTYLQQKYKMFLFGLPCLQQVLNY